MAETGPAGTDFGDWTPADSYAPDNVPDPTYVARRLHEIRAHLEDAAGRELPGWDQLDEDTEKVAIALATDLTKHLLTTGRDGSALHFHEAETYLSGRPGWSELDRDEQAVALAIVDDVIRWLQIEGTVIQ